MDFSKKKKKKERQYPLFLGCVPFIEAKKISLVFPNFVINTIYKRGFLALGTRYEQWHIIYMEEFKPIFQWLMSLQEPLQSEECSEKDSNEGSAKSQPTTLDPATKPPHVPPCVAIIHNQIKKTGEVQRCYI